MGNGLTWSTTLLPSSSQYQAKDTPAFLISSDGLARTSSLKIKFPTCSCLFPFLFILLLSLFHHPLSNSSMFLDTHFIFTSMHPLLVSRRVFFLTTSTTTHLAPLYPMPCLAGSCSGGVMVSPPLRLNLRLAILTSTTTQCRCSFNLHPMSLVVLLQGVPRSRCYLYGEYALPYLNQDMR